MRKQDPRFNLRSVVPNVHLPPVKDQASRQHPDLSDLGARGSYLDIVLVAAKERTFEESIFKRLFVLREKQEQSKK